MQACSAGRGQSGFSRHLFGRAPGCNDREAEALSRQRSHQALRLSARQRRLWAEIGRLGPGQDRATKARVRRERRRPCRAPGAQTAAAQGSPEPSPSSPLGSRVKLCKPYNNPIPKELRSVVRFAFHQIVLANSIQNLPFHLKLTKPFKSHLRNHFRTPISGTTR